MADPDAPWEFEETPEEPPPSEAPVEAGEAAPPADGAPSGEEEFPPPPEELSEAQRKKKFICRHWIRPTFLQYKYIYNYRKNYYDDVIDYMDKRNRGLILDKPRAQTWAERALRTYTRDVDRSHFLDRNSYIRSFGVQLRNESYQSRKNYVNTFHAEHSNNYYQHKYKALLF